MHHHIEDQVVGHLDTQEAEQEIQAEQGKIHFLGKPQELIGQMEMGKMELVDY